MSTNVDIEIFGPEFSVEFLSTKPANSETKMNDTDYCQSQPMPDRQEDGENVLAALRLRLSLAIKKAIDERDLTHADAALMARTPRTSITAIANGNLERVSMDRLVTIAYQLGVGIGLRLRTSSAN